jgi:hypothetical protein
MRDGLLRHLFARAVAGRAAPTDLRVLDFLADPTVNRRAFGQPLVGTVGYYAAEYLRFVLGREDRRVRAD